MYSIKPEPEYLDIPVVTEKTQKLIEEDAAMDLQAQAALHFELIQHMVVGSTFALPKRDFIAQQTARARALMHRGVPITPAPEVAAASGANSNPDEGTAPHLIHDPRRPRCFDALIRWMWPAEFEAELSDLLVDYCEHGYFDVDYINSAGSPEKVTLLECAVKAENAWAVSALMDAGADLSLVPLKDAATIGGKVVPAGHFEEWISTAFEPRSPVGLAVCGALMRRAIHGSAGAIEAAMQSSSEVIASHSDVKGKADADGGSARRRRL